MSWIRSYPLIFIEAMAVLFTLLAALVVPQVGSNWFRAREESFNQFARRRVLSVLTVGLLALAGRAALLPLVPIPEPGTHDEFSYLLAADTFAGGRLTNPPHPLWIHFESLHIIQQPTYMSMYPVAQGLALAAGQVCFGHPWWGVWLSVGVLCGALCWMLQGWLPPQWALLGALLAVIRLGLLSYWIDGYMGGATAAIGGALVIGAWPRIIRSQRVRDALLMAAGAAILANSRPYEGLIFCVPVALTLLLWVSKKKGEALRTTIKRVVLPGFLLLLVVGCCMGYYFWSVTGSPLRMPYVLNRDTYGQAQVFLWQSPKPAPAYHHQVMRDFYSWELETAMGARSLGGFVRRELGKILTLGLFYLGPVFVLPLFMLPRILRDKRMRLLLIIGGVTILILMGHTWFSAHYAAPMTCVIYAVVVQGMRHLWYGPQRIRGRFIVRSIPIICLLMIPIALTARSLHRSGDLGWRQTWFCTMTGMLDRAAILRQLESLPGNHLVIVRYQPDHNVHGEWVYNDADIDHAKVVWAREMDKSENETLINYFTDRKVWLLEADKNPPKLSPYTPVSSVVTGPGGPVTICSEQRLILLDFHSRTLRIARRVDDGGEP